MIEPATVISVYDRPLLIRAGFYFKIFLPLLLLSFLLTGYSSGFTSTLMLQYIALAIAGAVIFALIHRKYLVSISISSKELLLNYRLWDRPHIQRIPADANTYLVLLKEARAKYETYKYKLVIVRDDKIIFEQSEAGDWDRAKLEEVKDAFRKLSA